MQSPNKTLHRTRARELRDETEIELNLLLQPNPVRFDWRVPTGAHFKRKVFAGCSQD